MTEQVFLPAEIEQMAQNVSIEKRNEVKNVLNHIFNGVSKMREQLDLVVVHDENDKTSMKMANTIRLGVRQERLNGEKEIDKKREELRLKMLSDKTEDSLWLKSKQIMQILTKEIEETAKWKEATKERIEAERKELKTQERIIKISKFNPEINRNEFENMSDSMFDLFFASIEKQYNDKIEAEKQAEAERLEKERIQKLHNERKEALLMFWKYVAPEHQYDNLGELTDAEWLNLGKTLDDRKKSEDQENERIRIENERLQKEKQEAERKEKERIEAEKKAAKAPDKEKLTKWIESLNIAIPELNDLSATVTASDISSQFEGFKKWAKSEIAKL